MRRPSLPPRPGPQGRRDPETASNSTSPTALADALREPERSLPTRTLLLVHAALLIAQLAWASLNVWGVKALRTLPVFELMPFRTGCAGLVYLLVACVFERASWPALLSPSQRWHTLRLVLAAGAYRGGGLVLYFFGLRNTTASNAGVLQLLIPIWVLFLCLLFRGEPRTPLKIGAVVVAVGCSVGLMDLSHFGGAALGDLLICIMTLTTAAWMTWVGPLTRQVPMFTFNACTLLASTCLYAPLMLTQRAQLVSPLEFTRDVWLSLAMVVIVGTILYQVLEYWAMVTYSPVLAGAYSPMQAVGTLLLEWLVLSVLPSLRQALCAAGVVAALGVVSWIKWRDNDRAQHEGEGEGDTLDQRNNRRKNKGDLDTEDRFEDEEDLVELVVHDDLDLEQDK